MNNIKFRGKTEGGEWVYGYFGEKLNPETEDMDSFIITATLNVIVSSPITYFTDTQVIPESVGQFVGLRDKNRKEIYAGDIIEFYLFGEEKNLKETGYICYSERRAAFMIKVKSGEKLLLALNIPTSISILDPDPNFEVIGNTTDNPELIK